MSFPNTGEVKREQVRCGAWQSEKRSKQSLKRLYNLRQSYFYSQLTLGAYPAA